MFLQVSFLFLSRKKKRDGPGGRERGTVLGGRKEGRSLKEEKRDGPGGRERGTVLGGRERGTVLEGRKEGRSLEEEKKRDGP